MSTKESDALIAALLTMLVLVNLAFADVVTTYDGGFSVGVAPQPVIPWLQIPPCGGTFIASPTGFSRTLYAYTLETASGYKLTSLLSDLNTALPGSLSLSLSSGNGISSGSVIAYSGNLATGTPVGSASVVRPYGQIALSKGEYAIQQVLTLSAPVTSSTTATGSLNYSFQGVTLSYNVQETLVAPTGNAFNLLNGASSFPSSYAYQGDNNGNPSSSYPKYYSSSNASSYWGTSSGANQPVYELVENQRYSAGGVFWNENYDGGDVTVTVIAAYGSGSSTPADGLEVYMFLNPKGWAADSASDDKIPYVSSGTRGGTNSVGSFSPYQGDVILPYSHGSSQYVVVQWDPYWQIGGTYSGATGQFSIWIVQVKNANTYSVAPYPSPDLGSRYSGWDGVGAGYFKPNPQDYVCLTVTYDPSNGYIYASALDLNTGRVAMASESVGSYFTAPSQGEYVFGVGGSTGGAYANWGFVLVNYANQRRISAKSMLCD